MNTDQQDILFDKWLDETATPEEFQQLNELLARDSDAACRFAWRASIDRSLRESHWIESQQQVVDQFTGVRASMPLLQHPAAEADTEDLRLRPVSTKLRFPRKLQALVVSCLLSALVLVAFYLSRATPAEGEATAIKNDIVAIRDRDTGIIATIVSATGMPANALKSGTTLSANDRIEFESGNAEVRFLQGVSAKLSGAVDLELVDSNRAILHRGHLVANVEPAAHGFTIVTKHADIIDLGTTFEVSVDSSGDADVHVLEGNVLIDRRHMMATTAIARYRNLRAGESTRLTGYGQFLHVLENRSPAGEILWTERSANLPSEYLESIADNFFGESGTIEYVFTPSGFDEDSLCFVDRPYEWNSLPGTPFPEILKGRDYLCFMNELKLLLNYQVKLRLRQPANLYLLLDRRSPVPDWLAQSFSKTDMVIGMDEYDPRALFGTRRLPNVMSLGIGPGESIDQTYDIWVKHCKTPGDIVLGPLANSLPFRSVNGERTPIDGTFNLCMYGIVVTEYSDNPNAR